MSLSRSTVASLSVCSTIRMEKRLLAITCSSTQLPCRNSSLRSFSEVCPLVTPAQFLALHAGTRMVAVDSTAYEVLVIVTVYRCKLQA